jgi:hypothetical protein
MDVNADDYGLHEIVPAGFIVGVDLGQANDFTAITVAERHEERFTKPHDGRKPDRTIRHYQLRHAQRLPLGTSYPDVAEYVGRMVASLSVPTQRSIVVPDLVVDGTGVGKPVVDMMRRAGLKPEAVAITGGREETSATFGSHAVPKRNLVSSLIVAFQEGRLKLSAGIPAIAELEHELLNFKARISATGHDTYDAWRESIHDDLVLATALAIWWGERGRQSAIVRPLMSVLSR